VDLTRYFRRDACRDNHLKCQWNRSAGEGRVRELSGEKNSAESSQSILSLHMKTTCVVVPSMRIQSTRLCVRPHVLNQGRGNSLVIAESKLGTCFFRRSERAGVHKKADANACFAPRRAPCAVTAMSAATERDPLLSSASSSTTRRDDEASDACSSAAAPKAATGSGLGPLEIKRSTRFGILAGIWVATFLSVRVHVVLGVRLSHVNRTFNPCRQFSL
jgi:hypothetical protein